MKRLKVVVLVVVLLVLATQSVSACCLPIGMLRIWGDGQQHDVLEKHLTMTVPVVSGRTVVWTNPLGQSVSTELGFLEEADFCKWGFSKEAPYYYQCEHLVEWNIPALMAVSFGFGADVDKLMQDFKNETETEIQGQIEEMIAISIRQEILKGLRKACLERPSLVRENVRWVCDEIRKSGGKPY